MTLYLALTENRLFSRQLSDGFLSAFSHQPKKSWFPWTFQHFGLKIFTSVFQKWGEILVFEKMLNFLSFLVLLYVSGHFKQKKFFKIFQTDRKISSPIHVVYSILKLFPWWLIFGWWLKADKKPSESWRLKSRLSVSATHMHTSVRLFWPQCEL